VTSRLALLALAAVLLLSGCTATPAPVDGRRRPAPSPSGSPAAGDGPDPYAGYVSQVYHGTDHWVCSPLLEGDACRPVTGVAVAADGGQSTADLTVTTDPAFDCFYVYPTTSRQSSLNADLSVDGEVRGVVHAQAAPFSSVCRVFAPVYRQLTVHAIDVGVANINNGTYNDQAAADVAYRDVLDAWRAYLAEANKGRGFVLIGDSQGTFMLKRLLHDEIEPRARTRRQFVSAILLGGSVLAGTSGTGGDTASPPCARAGQVGCVIAYEPFPAGSPPGSDALFAQAPRAGQHLLCVNPAALAGRATVDAITSPTNAGVRSHAQFAVLPDALPVECRSAGSYDYLAVGRAASGDQRPLNQWLDHNLNPGWGYHGIEMGLAQGSLLRILTAQAAAYH
jgi:hypothetical protein